ncbi:MAG: helix-turn-helix domain-containing protein [Niameybacter sp.]|uniref:MerR family transcriptional regulator n=1 Tax=Niameybacter sp. TaxID=2033640 RepID=UPI002FCC92CD
MDRRFSIGEVSKLHNVSVQTLRHYDKVGLLKPAYINESSKYRYYSVKHFIMLDFIKQCKAMGLTLDEIKELMDHHTSVDAILEVITKQKEMVTKKIEELQQIQKHIEILEDKIQTALNEGIGSVFVKYCPTRYFIKYNNTKRYTEEFEIKLTETLRDLEKEHGVGHKELAFATSYEKFKQDKQLTYDHMMIGYGENKSVVQREQVVLPEGHYLTLNFDDDFKNTSPYYAQLLTYIEAQDLQVGKTFYESYMITRMDLMNNEEKSLGQIQIQLIEKVIT